jgi:hypothetical protein
MYEYVGGLRAETCDINKIIKKYALLLTIQTEVDCGYTMCFRFKISKASMRILTLDTRTSAEISISRPLA